jgi:hypothetical protein
VRGVEHSSPRRIFSLIDTLRRFSSVVIVTGTRNTRKEDRRGPKSEPLGGTMPGVSVQWETEIESVQSIAAMCEPSRWVRAPQDSRRNETGPTGGVAAHVRHCMFASGTRPSPDAGCWWQQHCVRLCDSPLEVHKQQ